MTRFQGRDAEVAWKDNQLAIQHYTDTSIAVPMLGTVIAAK